jgi:putative spermidine/putrescine transport system ATP-binding protein
MMHKLRLMQVAKRYGEVVALRPTSLDVGVGEFLTLLGPSGSGKTTLLQLVAGLLPADEGEVWIEDRPAADDPPHKRDIGMIFQNYALFPHLTAAENIAFPLKMRKLPAESIRRRVDQMLALVQLPHVAERFPKELSGGQQQRIALARAAVYEPSVILMDEPLGALDKSLREDMQFEIKRIHRELGATILYVTHDQDEAMAMSDRICLMRDGGIEQIGTPAELYFAPRTVFAARFLGHSNILSGKITVRGESEVTVDLDGGSTITARHGGQAQAVGEKTWVLVRPESVSVVSGAALPNRIEATMEFSVIMGSVNRRHWRLHDGTLIIQTALTTPDHALIRPGDTAVLGWSSASSLVLDGRGAP